MHDEGTGDTDLFADGHVDYGDELLFTDEIESEDLPPRFVGEPWKILIVDDDTEVHAITRVVLSDIEFDGRPIACLSAYSGAEANQVAADHPDLAVILLDVVMETDDAGLRVVRHIREILGNRNVRIVLRTGQPGQAPERQVIVAYEINDYKSKNELTAQKLFTTVIAALRDFQRTMRVEESRAGLRAISETMGRLLVINRLDIYLGEVLREVAKLVGPAEGHLRCKTTDDGMRVAAAEGCYAGLSGKLAAGCLDPAIAATVQEALISGQVIFLANHTVLRLGSIESLVVLLVGPHPPLPDHKQDLIRLLCNKVSVGFDKLFLLEQLANAQKATVYALGKLSEYKDEVTGNHVQRVERWSESIARELQARGQFPDIVTDHFCSQIGMASILHDVGKVAIPDAILRKPGPLTPEEREVMRSHAYIGASILREASQMVAGSPFLGMAADIAQGHHEWYGGGGYPSGAAGEAIKLSARIVAVADVYDALRNARPYKRAWTRRETIDLLLRESGNQFDPSVVDAFLAVESRLEGALDAA